MSTGTVGVTQQSCECCHSLNAMPVGFVLQFFCNCRGHYWIDMCKRCHRCHRHCRCIKGFKPRTYADIHS